MARTVLVFPVLLISALSIGTPGVKLESRDLLANIPATHRGIFPSTYPMVESSGIESVPAVKVKGTAVSYDLVFKNNGSQAFFGHADDLRGKGRVRGAIQSFLLGAGRRDGVRFHPREQHNDGYGQPGELAFLRLGRTDQGEG